MSEEKFDIVKLYNYLKEMDKNKDYKNIQQLSRKFAKDHRTISKNLKYLKSLGLVNLLRKGCGNKYFIVKSNTQDLNKYTLRGINNKTFKIAYVDEDEKEIILKEVPLRAGF
jgi:DNA-binding transcriptional ArsR family regulator